MPKMGGRELAEKVKVSHPSLKIVFMSGYADDDVVHSSAVDEAIAFLTKPITPTALLVKVRNILDGNEDERDVAA